MSTSILTNERTSRKGTSACANSTNCSPNRRPSTGLPGDSNNRTGEALPLTTDALTPKANENGNGKPAPSAPNGAHGNCRFER
jgi:hypothetical protein